MENIIDSEEVLAIFEGLHLTNIDDILNMPINQLRNLSISPAGQHEKLEL